MQNLINFLIIYTLYTSEKSIQLIFHIFASQPGILKNLEN